jgi:hypothetical protein
MIIIEGADGTGKSTLAAALQERLEYEGYGVRVVHNGPPPTGVDPVAHYAAQMDEAVRLLPRGTLTIFDRSFVGEVVYPAMPGSGRQPMDATNRRELEKRWWAYGGTIIYMQLTDAAQQAVFGEDGRGDDLWTAAQVVEASGLFERWFEDAFTPWVRGAGKERPGLLVRWRWNAPEMIISANMRRVLDQINNVTTTPQGG